MFLGDAPREEMTELRGTECRNCLDTLWRASQATERASRERMRMFQTDTKNKKSLPEP